MFIYSKRCQELREKRGWSKPEMAKRMEIRTSHYEGIERAQDPVGWIWFERIVKAAAVFDVPVWHLFCEDHEVTQSSHAHLSLRIAQLEEELQRLRSKFEQLDDIVRPELDIPF